MRKGHQQEQNENGKKPAAVCTQGHGCALFYYFLLSGFHVRAMSTCLMFNRP